MVEKILLIYCVYLAVISVITFLSYGVDKRKAIKGRRRISEKTLLTFSLIGGAYGGLTGMLFFRHKTAREHWYFSLLNVLGIIIHTALVVYLTTKI